MRAPTTGRRPRISQIMCANSNAAIAAALASVARAVATCRFSTILPSTHGHALPGRLCLPRTPSICRCARSTSSVGRREHLIRDRHLRRMDQRLAVKAQIAALLAFRAQPVVVLEGIINAIDADHVRAAARPAGRSASWSSTATDPPGTGSSDPWPDRWSPARSPVTRGCAAISIALMMPRGVSIIAQTGRSAGQKVGQRLDIQRAVRPSAAEPHRLRHRAIAPRIVARPRAYPVH